MSVEWTQVRRVDRFVAQPERAFQFDLGTRVEERQIPCGRRVDRLGEPGCRARKTTSDPHPTSANALARRLGRSCRESAWRKGNRDVDSLRRYGSIFVRCSPRAGQTGRGSIGRRCRMDVAILVAGARFEEWPRARFQRDSRSSAGQQWVTIAGAVHATAGRLSPRTNHPLPAEQLEVAA